MSITSVEVATTASQLSSVASWLEQAGDTHVRATASARDGFAALPAVWRGPACELTVRAGTGLIERVEPVGPQLVEAGATVRRAADLGEPIAERWLRAVTEGAIRGIPQALLVVGTTAVAAFVGAISGPFAFMMVPMVLAGGIYASVKLDQLTSWVADQVLDEIEWLQDVLRWSADGLDPWRPSTPSLGGGQ